MCISLLSIEIKYFPKDTWSQDAFHTDRKPHTTPWTLCPNKTPRATIIITKSQWARGSFWFCSFWKSREEMPKCPSAIVFLISTIKLRTGTHTKIPLRSSTHILNSIRLKCSTGGIVGTFCPIFYAWSADLKLILTAAFWSTGARWQIVKLWQSEIKPSHLSKPVKVPLQHLSHTWWHSKTIPIYLVVFNREKVQVPWLNPPVPSTSDLFCVNHRCGGSIDAVSLPQWST